MSQTLHHVFHDCFGSFFSQRAVDAAVLSDSWAAEAQKGKVAP